MSAAHDMSTNLLLTIVSKLQEFLWDRDSFIGFSQDNNFAKIVP